MFTKLGNKNLQTKEEAKAIKLYILAFINVTGDMLLKLITA